jgi:hypothetical protein
VIRCDLCGSKRRGEPQLIGRAGKPPNFEEVFCPRRFHDGPIEAAEVERLLAGVADRLESHARRVRRMVGLVAELQHTPRPDPSTVIAVRHQIERDHPPSRKCGTCDLAMQILDADTAARTRR